MASRSRPRRVGRPALQRRSGRESRSHHPRAEKGSAADYYDRAEGGRAEPGCADATCAHKGSGVAQSLCPIKSGRALESNESGESIEAGVGENSVGKIGIGKNAAGENKLSPAQRIKKFSEARSFAAATVTALRKP